MQNFDKSLCGSYDRVDYQIVETNKIEIEPEFLTKCTEVLIDKCVKEVIFPSQVGTLVNRVSKLVQDCALDIRVGVESVGKFQITIFEQTIFEELTKSYKSSYCTSGTCLSEQGFLILKNFCFCKKMRPSKLTLKI